MLSKQGRIRIRTFHRWAGAILGIQLLIWVVTGVYFAWVSIDDIRGDSNKVQLEAQAIPLGDLISPKDLALPSTFQVKAFRLETGPQNPVYRLESAAGETKVADAWTGELKPILTLPEAMSIGLKQVKTKAAVVGAQVITEKEGEYKVTVPAIRVDLDDLLSTRLYLDAWTGKLIVQRNSLWRIYDFFWMLHIMDYSTREDFNNPWIKGMSLGGLTVIITGYLLFFLGRFTRRSSKRKN